MEPIHPAWTCWGAPVDSTCIAHSGMCCGLLDWSSSLHCDSCHFILSVLWWCHKCWLMRPPRSLTDFLLVPAQDITAAAQSVSPWTDVVSVWTKGDSTVWCQLGYQHCPISPSNTGILAWVSEWGWRKSWMTEIMLYPKLHFSSTLDHFHQP